MSLLGEYSYRPIIESKAKRCRNIVKTKEIDKYQIGNIRWLREQLMAFWMQSKRHPNEMNMIKQICLVYIHLQSQTTQSVY